MAEQRTPSTRPPRSPGSTRPTQPSRPRGRVRPVAAARQADAAHFGRYGEAAAARWYRRAGYRVLSQNWHCREGELDLVVAKDRTVTFVEVKARANDRFGTGAEAVDHRKQRKIRTAAIRWLDEATQFVGDIRFDVVEVDRRGHLTRHPDCF